jgi:hypothetical protein
MGWLSWICACRSIANARKVIGYAPEDNSGVRFIDAVTKHVAAAKAKGVGK